MKSLRFALLMGLLVFSVVARSAHSVVVHLSDLEGNMGRLSHFLEKNPYVKMDAQGKLTVPPGVHFVYGGDLSDRGQYSDDITDLIVAVKKKYPKQVTLIAGNRDVNKLRIPQELIINEM